MLFLSVSQLYNYFFGFMKCRIVFLGLEYEKSLRNKEKYGVLTKLDLFFTRLQIEASYSQKYS